MMKEFTVKEGTVKVDGMEVEEDCTRLILPPSVREIDDFAFFGNGTLEEVVFSEGLQRIGDCAFRECTALRSLVFPASLQTVGSSAFMDCSSLESAVFTGGGPKELPTGMFCNCKALKTVRLGSALQNLSTGMEIGGTFEDCLSLEEIVLPEGCEIIDWAAFSGCKNLSRIVLPSTLQKVGEKSLYGTAVKELVFAEGLRSLWKAIYGCEKLTRIVLPSTVTSLSYKEFGGGLPSLREVVLPKRFEGDLELYFQKEDFRRIHITFI